MSEYQDAINILKWRKNPSLFYRYCFDEEPSRGQREFLEDCANLENRRLIVCAGRTTGKTKACASLALWTVNPLAIVERRPMSCNILSGSLSQSQVLYSFIEDACTKKEFLRNRLLKEPTRTFTRIIDGGWIRALPASKKTVLSQHSDLLIIDEAGEESLADGELILDAYPLVSGSPYSRIVFTSTPYEYMSYFVDLVENRKKYPEYKRYTWSTLDCSWINPRDIEEAKKQSEDRFKIHWLGDPVPIIGTLFSLEDLKACRVDVKPILNEDILTTMGIDWAYSPNLTVVTIIQKVGEVNNIVYIESFEAKKFSYVKERIRELAAKYRVSKIIADSSHIDRNHLLKEEGLYLQEIKFKGEKPTLQANLSSLIEKHKIRIWEGYKELLDQLRKYTYSTNTNDDYVDSLMLSLKESIRLPSMWYFKRGKSRRGREEEKREEEEKESTG